MQFVNSHLGPFLMLALLAVLVLVFGLIFGAVQALPVRHPLRTRVEILWHWLKENPELAGKRLQQSVFALLVLVFTILTIVYS
ncbi:hypothetical protein [Duganella sp. S19_KUP01_CR8]|uniref:hypothetical protein n=1 Tax=Duganella sp. S19_KUP01_CR8 TaxID=3025502 RepID=UPI002FCDD9CD